MSAARGAVLTDPREAVLDTALLVRGGGFGLMLHAVTDGPPELAPAITQCVLLLADLPATRCFFKAGNDIEVRRLRP